MGSLEFTSSSYEGTTSLALGIVAKPCCSVMQIFRWLNFLSGHLWAEKRHTDASRELRIRVRAPFPIFARRIGEKQNHSHSKQKTNHIRALFYCSECLVISFLRLFSYHLRIPPKGTSPQLQYISHYLV